LGFLYANFLDWYIHILLHKPKGKSRFKFHWKHHGVARKNGNLDNDYSQKLFHNETWLTLAGVALHLPLLYVWFSFAATAIVYALLYAILHRRTHQNVEFYKKWMPWHYEHHMGKNQNANWCVLVPFMDYIMGTREKWLDQE
jgi:sterol desaturase/sphingolipid hydroxylase (fatty acid hydroxylase superfamily)